MNLVGLVEVDVNSDSILRYDVFIDDLLGLGYWSVRYLLNYDCADVF